MYKVPVVEANPYTKRTDIVLVPLEGLDYFLSDISGDYDLGLGTLSGELGAVKVKAKASVNVKKPAPPPKPKASAPKPAAKAPPKPANKPQVSKPLPKATKPVAKPTIAKSAAKPTAAKPKIVVKAKAKPVAAKKPTTAAKGKPAIKQIKPATKAKLSAVLKKTKVAPKAPATKKPIAKLDTSKLKAVARKAVSAVQAASKKSTAKPIAIRTTIKEGLYPQVTPISKPAQEGAAAARAVLATPSVQSLPVETRTKIAIKAAADTAATPSQQVRLGGKPSAKVAKQSSKPIAKMVKKLDKTQPSKSCTCVVATKKPEQAGLNTMSSLEVRYAKLEERLKRLGRAAGVRYV